MGHGLESPEVDLVGYDINESTQQQTPDYEKSGDGATCGEHITNW